MDNKSTLFILTTFLLAMIPTASVVAISNHQGFSRLQVEAFNRFNYSHPFAKKLKTSFANNSMVKEYAEELLQYPNLPLPKMQLVNGDIHFKYRGRRYKAVKINETTYRVNGKVLRLPQQQIKSALWQSLEQLNPLSVSNANAAPPLGFYLLALKGGVILGLICWEMPGLSDKLSRYSSSTPSIRMNFDSIDFFTGPLDVLNDVPSSIHDACVGKASEQEKTHIDHQQALALYCDQLAQRAIDKEARYPNKLQPYTPDGKVNARWVDRLKELGPHYHVGTIVPDILTTIPFYTCNSAKHCPAETSQELSFDDLPSQDQIHIEGLLKDRELSRFCLANSLGRLKRATNQGIKPPPVAK